MVELDQLAVGVESHSNGVYELTVDEVRQSFSDRLSKGQLPAQIRGSDTEFQVRRLITKLTIWRMNGSGSVHTPDPLPEGRSKSDWYTFNWCLGNL